MNTYELPTLFVYFVYPSDGFHKYIIGHACLGNPDCAQKMGPFPIYCLLKRTSFVRT